MKQATLGLILISTSANSLAGFVDGNELSKWEKEQSKANFESGLFNGYVAGVVDVGDGILFCTTSGVTRGQLSAIAAKYLKNNPEQWNKQASTLVIESMKSAFPCEE